MSASQLAPTIFPIVFATIIARVMKSFALRRAEGGTQLALLEQLLGSQSLGSTIERAVLLRRVPGFISEFHPGEVNSFGVKTVASLLQALLLGSSDARSSPTDSWGNVKNPRLDTLSPFDNSSTGFTWTDINATGTTRWSSWNGLMVQGLPSDRNSTFIIGSSYLDFTCANDTPVDFAELTKMNQTDQATKPITFDGSACVTTYTSRERLEYQPMLVPQVNLLYVSTAKHDEVNANAHVNPPEYDSYDVFNCSLAQARVDSNVTCHGRACYVTRMRKSEDQSYHGKALPFSGTEYFIMLKAMPVMAGVPASTGQEMAYPIHAFLLGSNSTYFQPLEILPGFSDISGALFAQRLTTFFNTVWQASLVPYDITLGSQANFTHLPDSTANTTATITNRVPIYSANITFIVLFILTTLILHACAVWGLILKYTTTAPDILGYVSTMTRDNPYTDAVPPGGTSLDGLQRARLRAGLTVQLSDVDKQNRDAGQLALRTVANEENFDVGRIKNGRLYA